MSSKQYSLTICIAGMHVAIACPDSACLEKLQQRYHLFLDGKKPILTIQAELSKPLPLDPISEQLSFQGSQVIFSTPTLQGFVDVEALTADVRVSDQHPIPAIDHFLRVVYTCLVFQLGGVLFHGAGILHRQNGYLFMGHSGAGKTTVSRLSVNDQVLNDDLVVVLPTTDPGQRPIDANSAWKNKWPWTIYSTPFWNPTQVKPSNVTANLVAVFHLVQDRQVYLEELGKGQAIGELVASVPMIPHNSKNNIGLLERLEMLHKDIPVFNLHFLPDASFWRIIDDL
jgi:hypothetical protein